MPDLLRLGVLATHPIQYHAPLFRELHSRANVDLTVFYAHNPSPQEQGAGFGVPFSWDVDLTCGYRNEWLANRRRPSVSGDFRGYDTPDIQKRIRAGAFDAFLVSGWHALTYWQAMLGCWRSRIPVLVRGDSQLPRSESVAWHAAKRRLYPLFIRRFAACLSVGRRSEQYFRYFGARTVVQSPHFVDNDFFREAGERERAAGVPLRARLGIGSTDVVILFAGKLEDKKRPLDVIRAVSLTGQAGIVALFVGDGPLRNECEREAARLTVRSHFAGFMNQTVIPAAYALADLLVLPSDDRETWGLVVNEAMASGLPVAVSRAAGCYPDLVVEGVTGYGFDVGDVAGLANIIRRVVASAEHRAALGRAAARHVSGYSVQAASEGVLQGVALAREIAS